MNDKSLITTATGVSVPAVSPQIIPSAVVYSSYSSENTVRPQPGSVLEYGGLLWRSKILFTGCMTAGLAIAVLILALQAPVYRARTTLEVQDVNHQFVDMKLASPIADPTSSDALTNIQTQIKILQSDTLVDSALKKAGIISAADLVSRQPEISRWAGIINLSGGAQPRETLADIAGKNLKVSVAGQTRIIEVSFDAPRPEIAAGFANALSSEYIDQNSQARWQMNHQTSEWLTAQLNELRDKLENSEKDLEAYARKASLIYTADKQTVSEEKLRQVQAELSKAQADRVEKQSRFEMARSARPDTLPDVLNDSNLRALETSLTDLRRQEAQLGVTFTGDYSKTKKLHAEAAALEEAISRKRAEIVSRIANELTEAQRREQLLRAAYADQTLAVTRDSEKSIQYDVLKREVDTNRQIYEATLQRVKEAGVAAAIRASNIRIVDPASAPPLPYKPNRLLASGLGLMLGFLAAGGFVIMREHADRCLRQPGEASLFLGVPELGVIPRWRSGVKLRVYYKRKAAAAAAGANGHSTLALNDAKPQLTAARESVELVTFQKKGSLHAESFHAAVTSLLFSGRANPGSRVIVVTSAGPSEGKSTVSSNLAIALAESNQRVLLVDADMRRPRIHGIFHLENVNGLSDVLSQNGAGGRGWIGAVRETEIPKLSVMPSGTTAASTHNLLYSRATGPLLESLRNEFDIVLIDTPPMAQMSDARVVAQHADGVVLVVRLGQTTRDNAVAALQRFNEDGVRVLGTILNEWDPKWTAGYGGYSGYYAAYSRPPVES